MVASARGLEGKQIGRYRLRFKIAEGGMAAVYLAQLAGAHDFERWVAVKVIHSNHAEDETFIRMLLDEAKVASKIHHPNVCSVLDFGETDGLVHLVMEYLEGETLSSVIRRAWRGPKGLPYWLAARTVLDAARGLHAAHDLKDPDGHSYGIVHRDVSPQNLVVLYDGHTKVIDFGIALARSNISSTKAGQVKGKIAYLAPEQLGAGAIIDRQADVWALGVVLWEATVGRRLFRASSAADTARNVVMSQIENPSESREDYPPELEAIVMQAVQRNRGARYADAKSLADDLEAFLYKGGLPAGAAQVGEYMRRHFDDRLAVRQALLGADDGAGGGVLAVHDLHSETSLGSNIQHQVEKSGRRKKAAISEPPPPDPVDELLASLDEPDNEVDPELSDPPVEVVELAGFLEPEPELKPDPDPELPEDPPTRPGLKRKDVTGEPEPRDEPPEPARPRMLLPESGHPRPAPPPVIRKKGTSKAILVGIVLGLGAIGVGLYLAFGGL